MGNEIPIKELLLVNENSMAGQKYQHTFPFRAFRLKKALQDSQVVAPKLQPKAFICMQ